MNNRKWVIMIVAVLILAVGGIWIIVSRSLDDSELRIGILFPLSGEASSYGEKGRRAIELVAREAQHDLAIPIRVIYEDSRAEPSIGATAMQKLANVDRAQAVIGDIVSSVTLAAAPIAERNRIVLLSPTSSAPAITDAGEYIYRIWPSDLLEGSAIAEWAAEQDHSTAAILHLQNDYGISIADIFTRTFEDAGGTIVSRHGYAQDNPDYRTPLTQLRRLNPDVVYVAGYYADSAAILRQAHELGLSTQFLGTTAIEDPEFLNLAGATAEGIVYPLASAFDPDADDPQVRRFVDSFRSEYGETPGWVEAHSYDAFKLIIVAAQSCADDLTGECIKHALDTLGAYKGVTGRIEFDEKGDVSKPVQMKTVRNGAFVHLQ